jgi:hypothetical protein
MSLAGAAAITILPIIPPDQRAEWEAYSVKNQWWIEHDYLWRQEQKMDNGTTKSTPNHRTEQADLAGQSDEERVLQVEASDLDGSITPYIKNYVGIDLSPGPWFVWWQYVPVIKNSKCALKRLAFGCSTIASFSYSVACSILYQFQQNGDQGLQGHGSNAF